MLYIQILYSKFKHFYINYLFKSATCFYIGKDYFLTNKHYYNDVKTKNGNLDNLNTQNKVFIYNNYIGKSIEVKFVFITENSLDIAIMKLVNKEDLVNINNLKRIDIKRSLKLKPLDEIYSLSYSYFSLDDMFKIQVPIYTVRLYSILIIRGEK